MVIFLSCSTVWFLRALLFCRRLFIPFQSVRRGKAELKAHVNTMTQSARTVKSGVALLYDLWFVPPWCIVHFYPSVHLSTHPLLPPELHSVGFVVLWVWRWHPGCFLAVKHVSDLRKVRAERSCSAPNSNLPQDLRFSLKCVKTLLTWLADWREPISFIWPKTFSQLHGRRCVQSGSKAYCPFWYTAWRGGGRGITEKRKQQSP